MNAKEFLRQVQKLDRLIENKLVERDQWLSMATSTTAASAPETGVRVQSSGSQQKMADAVSRYIDIERDIDDCIDRLYDEKRKIIKVIEKLDVVQYDILHKMYVGIRKNHKTHYLSFNDIADIYDKSYSWATTMHGIALKHVQKIIDNCSDL
jgi:hypothetical protein